MSVTLMDRVEYRDIVNVGWLEPGQVRFPEGLRYPTSSLPATTRRLLELEGYISTDSELDVVREYIEGSPFNRMGCFMGVPIVRRAKSTVRFSSGVTPGTRHSSTKTYAVAYDLATQFGGHLPAYDPRATGTQSQLVVHRALPSTVSSIGVPHAPSPNLGSRHVQEGGFTVRRRSRPTACVGARVGTDTGTRRT